MGIRACGINPAADKRWNVCSLLDDSHPLVMRQLLVVAIDAQGISTGQLKLLSLNVANQPGAVINPNPIRSGFSATSSIAGALAGSSVYYLTWQNRLPGDNAVTLSVNTVFTPPMPGGQWTEDTFYPVGTIAVPKINNGHFYAALKGGFSGESEPGFPIDTLASVPDNSVLWLDVGTTPPAGGKPVRPWVASSPVAANDIVVDTQTGHYFLAIQNGTTGSTKPTFTVTRSSTVEELPRWARVDEGGVGGVIWQDAAPVVGKKTPAWSANTPFPKGYVIINDDDGHLYTTMRAGRSGDVKPAFVKHGVVADGVTEWQDSGIESWAATTSYSIGYVLNVSDDPQKEHFVVAITGGNSGNARPAFPTHGGRSVDGNVTWQDLGPEEWSAKRSYSKGYVVVEPASGRYYSAVNAGVSGGSKPEFPTTFVTPVTWQDLGAIAPTSAAPGPVTDVIVPIKNITLNQTHSLSYFNLAAGVVVNSVRNRTFGYTSGTPSLPTQTGSTLIVDPILLFTLYPYPLDTERQYHLRDLIPGVSFGFSLVSPSSNFYFGGSSEIMRNIQLTYGFALAKVPKLAPGSIFSPSPGGTATPTTVQSFEKGGFIGLTFSFLGFIPGH